MKGDLNEVVIRWVYIATPIGIAAVIAIVIAVTAIIARSL